MVGTTAYPAATRHGGGLIKAAAAFPDAPTPWLDLSTGINPQPWPQPWPHPWPSPRADDSALSRLPDPALLTTLEQTAATAFGVTDPNRLAAVPGAEAAIRLLPILLGGLLRARSVDIVSPTYGAHAESWRRSGAQVRLISPDEAWTSDADVLVIVNPNNPDGALRSRDTLTALARQRALKSRWLIVDESFIETTPEASVSDLTEPGLIVLRSFGKFYGLAGVRLGFMIAAPALIEDLRGLQGDWPVSADALVMGAAAYADTDWRRQTQARLSAAAARLDGLLTASGLTVLGGTSLFRLASTRGAKSGAAALFHHLGRSGILTRPFDYAPDWLRFGLPAPEDFERLQQALETRP